MILSFDDLPEEVLRSILCYMDIPSLAALCMTHKAVEHGNIASFASDDQTWYSLIQSRFGIGLKHKRSSRKHKPDGVVLIQRSSFSSLSSDGKKSNESCKRRPTTYGGKDWKNAYLSLASTMRIPETRVTTGSHLSGGAVFASPYLRGRQDKNRSVTDFFGMWCLVSHAENCRTKTVENHMGRRRRRRNHHDISRQPGSLPYRLDRRYIELKLCLQNTKSGFGRVVVPDISALRIASLDEEDYFSSWGWDKWDCDYDATFQIIDGGPWAPKMILRHRFFDGDASGQQQDVASAQEWNSKLGVKDLILRPFEVVVLSVHISCPDSLVYETDVLSSMSCIRCPIVADGWPNIRRERTEEDCEVLDKKGVSIARFLPEDSMWEHYCQLPGGCMSLKDRSRLVPV
mmetsp:Transcript_16334/g.39088  ORF Transcript_16334/g.39088 Transcript_16334/m.39088 type:complete len:401 (-) Transcript_16334:71-1273(-)